MSSCARCQAQLEEGDVRCPVCAQAVAAAVAFERPAGLRVLRCTECGAALSYSAEKQNPACDFCGAVMRVEEPVDPVERPEGRIRMTVDKERAGVALKAWLATRGFFRPSDLAAASTIDSLRPLWWAAWACEAAATVSWTADSDAGSNRSDWAPHSGQAQLKWDRLLISASRGLTRRETDALVGAYDATVEALPQDEAHLEQFELQRSAADHHRQHRRRRDRAAAARDDPRDPLPERPRQRPPARAEDAATGTAGLADELPVQRQGVPRGGPRTERGGGGGHLAGLVAEGRAGGRSRRGGCRGDHCDRDPQGLNSASTLMTADRPGLLADITNTFSKKGVNISQANCRATGDDRAVNTFEVTISVLKQLTELIRSIEKLTGVHSVERIQADPGRSSGAPLSRKAGEGGGQRLDRSAG